MKQGFFRLVVAAFLLMTFQGVSAAATVTIGLLGSYSATTWPFLIADKVGFFAEQKIEPDFVFASSAPSLTQQLIGGSIDVIGASGIAEPLLAVEEGAPVAILRVVGAVPNLELVSKPQFTSIDQLKGHMISVAQLSGMTRIMFEAMTVPQGLTVKDFEITEADSSGQRLAALESGAVDATILAPPFNFMAEQRGFKDLARLIDTAPNMPQTCTALNTKWAAQHADLVKGLGIALDKATQWLYDPKNRDAAIKIIVTASKANPDLTAKSLDSLLKTGYFAKTDTISRSAFDPYIADLRKLNYLKTDLKLDKAVYSTVKLTD